VVAIQAAWTAEFGAGSGTWSVVSGNLIQISGTTCDNVTLEFSI